jgi:putrescine transport system permease protein
MNKKSTFLISSLCFGFAFLYIPIVVLIIFSFNESQLVTVWTGFSTKWYTSLFDNTEILEAAWLSLKIAATSASFAVAIGTLAAIALTRFKRFRGRRLFSSLITAPLIMPEVITGLSLLLLFIALEKYIGWPTVRGFNTVTIAHITLSLAYVTIIVRTRLSSFDMMLEEAALDLGARPAKVFLQITLPLIMPALLSGWLLAFTLSLDDLIIASFVSGPAATTLPMVIYSSIRLGVTPEINALATIIILLVTTGILGSALFMRKRK